MERVPTPKTFADFGIWSGMSVTVRHHDSGLYPKTFTGMVETLYPNYALVRTDSGYYTTIHITDVACRFATVRPATAAPASAQPNKPLAALRAAVNW